MPHQRPTEDQTASGRSPKYSSGEPACVSCQAVMSRRLIGKPDSETGLSEVTYRCPKCGATITLWVRN